MLLALHHAIGRRFFAGPIILLILVVVVAYFLIARSRQKMQNRRGPVGGFDASTHDTVNTSSAERILSERFARGEIGLEDYRRRLVAIRESGADPGDEHSSDGSPKDDAPQAPTA